MANFSIRAQLHNAIPGIYPILHDAMSRAGIGRTITGRDGLRWQLPWGEYRLEDIEASAEAVRDYCQAVVRSVHPNASILVTEEVQSAWVRLT